MLEAIAFGHVAVKEIVEFIEEYREEALQMGLARRKMLFEIPLPEPAMLEAITATPQRK